MLPSPLVTWDTDGERSPSSDYSKRRDCIHRVHGFLAPLLVVMPSADIHLQYRRPTGIPSNPRSVVVHIASIGRAWQKVWSLPTRII